MEDTPNYDEESKEEDLDTEAGSDNVLAEINVAFAVVRCKEPSTFDDVSFTLRVAKFDKFIVPDACVKKERTSPRTNTFVSHLARMSE